METRREGLCTEEAQGPPALQRRGTRTWDHWLVTGKGERETGETFFDWELKEGYCHQKNLCW